MMDTRKATHRPLNCWDAHKRFLFHNAIECVDCEPVKTALANWVIQGDNAPQFGDELFDQIYAKQHNLYINRYFMFKSYEGETFHKCILRRPFAGHGTYDEVQTVTFNPFKMTLQIDLNNEIINL